MKTTMRLSRLLVLVLAVWMGQSEAGTANKNTNMAAGRYTSVEMFEWRWVDVADECERFLGPYGYGAAQVSPPSEHIVITNPERPWYELYQPVSYKIDNRNGNEEQFADMVERCNAVNVRIYVDGVFNHMTGGGPAGTGTAGSSYDPNSESYPAVPYTSANFHPCSACPSSDCQIDDYNDATQVRNCQLTGLLDLDQSNTDTRTHISDYMNKLIDYGVAGFRLDAAKHMWPDDIAAIVDGLHSLPTSHFAANTKAYIYQEVIDMGGEAVHYYDYTGIGDVTEFKYGSDLAYVFRRENAMAYLVNWGEGWGMMGSDDAIAFIDNHDTQRGSGPEGEAVLTFFDAQMYKMANAFMLAHPYGNTRVMSSYNWPRDYEGGSDVNYYYGPPHDDSYNILPVTVNADLTCNNGWICEHRWRQIYNMVRFRNTVAGTAEANWWDNGAYQIAFSRGNKGFLAINNEAFAFNQKLQTGLPGGTYCDIISGYLENGACTGASVTVASDGTAQINIGAYTDVDDPIIAIYSDAKLN